MVQVVGCIADARSGVAANRFAENLTLFELRQMFEDKRFVVLVSDNQKVLGGYPAGKALKGHSDK